VAKTFVRTLLLCRILAKGTLRLLAADSRYCHRRTGRCCDPTDQYMRALVSILIPVYNAEEWVVDHGSTDGTLAGRGNLSRMTFGVTQPNQGAAARVPSPGDTANPDELKMTLKNMNTWKSWRSYSSRRTGATLRCPAKNPGDLTTTIRTYFASDLYENLEPRPSRIREFGNERNPWTRLWRFWMGFIDGHLGINGTNKKFTCHDN
jgi:glycosyltransferase involved in cell wall biosynthesis